MPSGAKKRKKAASAKKKEEEEQMGSISHPPPSTIPLPPQQDKELEQRGEMESPESAKEESPSSEMPGSEAKDVSIEVAHSKEEEKEDEVSSVSERSSEVKDVSDEFVETKGEVGGGSNLGVESTEILFRKPSEEQFSEVQVSVPADSALSEESREIPSGLGGEASVTERSTDIVLQKDPVPIAHVSEEVVEATEVPVSVPPDSGLSEGEESREMPNMGTVIETSAADAHATAPLLEHRASVWNCCGLLDFFKASER